MAKTIAAMSLEEKVGQLFILAFPGKDYHKASQIIADYHIGGCYISQDNAETFAEAQLLSKNLQQAAQDDTGWPLILGVDQEGAWGVLLPEATIGPGNLALGLAENTEGTQQMYGVYAQEMSAVGYNTILAPCADVNLDSRNPIIGTRSFGEKPERVAAHVLAAVKALKQHGVLCAAKHFPGHGDTHSDTHREIPTVDKSLSVLRDNELLPFQAAIDAGVDLIMTSHILYPQVDAKYPATLSYEILSNLLRAQMGFRGVVITDSMNMGAMRKYYSLEDATVQTLLAGTDLIMLSEEHYDHDEAYWDNQKASISAVLRAVQNGRISEAMLDKKLERIFSLKQKLRSQQPVNDIVKCANGTQIEQRLARSAIKVLRNKNNLVPLRRNAKVALVNATPKNAYHNLLNVRGIGPNQAEPAFAAFAKLFCELWAKGHSQARVLDYGADLALFDVVIVVTEDHPLPGEDFDKSLQLQRVQQLQNALHDKLLVLALRSPYDLQEFPAVPCYVSTYSGRSCAARAAAEFLAGTSS